MFKSLKTALPLALLACFAFAGCNSSSTSDTDLATEAVSETATENPVVPDNPPPSESQAQNEGSAGTKANDRAAKGKEMLDQIKAFLQPDVIGPALDKNLATFQETLIGITDEASATAALPQLDAFSKAISQVYTVSGMVPDESRPILAEKLNAAAGPIKAAVERLYANKDTEKVVRPIFMRAMRSFDELLSRFPVEPAESEASAEDTETPAEDAETPAEDAETPAEDAEAEATEAAPSE